MLNNYLKIIFRNIVRQKGYSFINIFGLAIGMVGAILIMLFVHDELSFDNYHKNGDRIYRLERKGVFNGKNYHIGVTAHPMGPAMANDFPEIEQSVRIWPVELMVKDRFNTYAEERVFFADQNLFQVFSFPLVTGDVNSVLTKPNSIVISVDMRQKYFGNSNPINKTFTLQWDNQDLDFKVTGVMENIPRNSHFHPEFLGSYSSLDQLLGNERLNVWISNSIYTYLLLKKNTNPEDLYPKFPQFIDKYMGETARKFLGPDLNVNDFLQFRLRPIADIYLYSKLSWEMEPTSDINRVYIFSSIALFLLIIAGINFMNLSTARSARRVKEVGLRKVAGATRAHFIGQFLGESILLSSIALIVALILTELVLPAFNSFTLKELSINYFNDYFFISTFILIVLFVGIFSGSYPAFYLSKFQPAQALKSTQSSISGSGSPLLRKLLVVIQFSISIVLIIGTTVVMDQLGYMQNKKVGFEKEQVLVISSQDNSVFNKLDIIKADLKEDPAIIHVSASSKVPGNRNYSDSGFRKEGANNDDLIIMHHFAIDEDFIPTLGMEIVAGRNFSKEFQTDAEGFIINETAYKRLGYQSADEAIGKNIGEIESIDPMTFEDRKIIGVVKDFNFRSLHNLIAPLILEIDPEQLYYVSIKINSNNISETLQSIEKNWKKYSPQYPFDYFFLDDNFNNLYLAELRTLKIFTVFALLAIFIASLGLLGLASFTSEQRTKEIGVRKVLGASIFSVVLLLTKEFTKWILIANIIAWPVGYWLMNSWLQNFTYRMELGIGIFIFATTIALLTAILTVSLQAIKAAMANPVDALKYE